MKEDDEFSDSDSDMEPEYERVVNPGCVTNRAEALAAGIKLRPESELQGDKLFSDAPVNGKYVVQKPCDAVIQQPTNMKNDPSMPDEDLEIDHVYGYSVQRDVLTYNTKGEIVYPAAGLVVTYNPKRDDQRYYRGHNDDVTCLAGHPLEPDIVASGQVATIVDGRATMPHICVHNTRTGEDWVIKNAGQRQIRTLDFSADGRYLAAVAADDENTVSVYDWRAGKRLASLEGDTNIIMHLRWNHLEDDSFVTVGKRHVYFWNFDGKTLTKKRGRLGKFATDTFPCVGFSEKGYACVGTQGGSIMVFVGEKCKKAYKVHRGAVYAIDWYKGGLVSGGKDGFVCVLDKRVKPIEKIDMPGRVRSLRVYGDNLLVGTSHAEVFEIRDFLDGPNKLEDPVVRGHWDGELWALDESPDGSEFATAGEDNWIAVWDAHKHVFKRGGKIAEKRGKRLKGGRGASSTTKHAVNQCCRALAWSPDGAHIAMGLNSGELVVVDAQTLERLHEVDLNKHGKRKVKGQKENWIEAISYSPDGRTLAVGTHGIVICLCDATQGYRCEGRLTAHNAAPTHLDWSEDGKYLQSNCRAYELLFHDVDTDKLSRSEQNTSSNFFKDVAWQTPSCILGWHVKGVFDPGMDGTDVNTAAVNPKKTLIATGDDFGYVSLWRYPAWEQGNARRKKGGHSSHVMRVLFSRDGQRLWSTGGGDKSIIQWSVVDRTRDEAAAGAGGDDDDWDAL